MCNFLATWLISLTVLINLGWGSFRVLVVKEMQNTKGFLVYVCAAKIPTNL